MNRRDFLAAASVSLAAPAFGIDPFDRPGPGPMKLSLSAYSLRQELTAGRMSLVDFVSYCRRLGVPGAELTSYYFPEGFAAKPGEPHTADVAYLAELKRHCHVSGVSISGGAIRNDFCLDPVDLPVQLDHVRRWVEVYEILGAPAIRVFAGNSPKGVSEEDAVARCVAGLNEVVPYAGRRGVWLALENHGGITSQPDTMLDIVRGVQGGWFGVNFDSGNFRLEDPYTALAQIAPFAVNAQIKVEMFRPNVDGRRGDKYEADLERVVKTLRDAGYGGWVALEYEGKEPPLEAVPRWLDRLRDLLS